MGDVGLAIQRAEDKTEQMKARAGAIDELMASGALDDMVSGPRDDIQAELDRMGASTGVDHELEQMKAALAAGARRGRSKALRLARAAPRRPPAQAIEQPREAE